MNGITQTLVCATAQGGAITHPFLSGKLLRGPGQLSGRLVFLGAPGTSYRTIPQQLIHDFPGTSRVGIPMLSQRVAVAYDSLFHKGGSAVSFPSLDDYFLGAIFVMLGDGDIYVTRRACHHPGLVGGLDAAAAGELYELPGSGGDHLTVVSDRSGHYTPAPEYTAQFLIELWVRGFDLSKILVRLTRRKSEPLIEAIAFLSSMGMLSGLKYRQVLA